MTRDNFRVVDDLDGDAEVFSALWAAAPSFPQLPPDAPPELRVLTVDVRDPKRVYAIYRASRRHNFQLLVERYITQLRYGCQDVHCNISTCFTCRRRSAGTKPLRRYNATSARTLACFLASRDNPEKGLCQALRFPLKTGGHSRVSSATRASVDIVGNEGVRLKPSKPISSQHRRQSVSTDLSTPLVPSQSSDEQKHENELKGKGDHSRPTNDDPHIEQVRSSLERPVKRDHKSFVQNMFGTVAFRMIEWLTPKNLEDLITADNDRRDLPPPKQKNKDIVDNEKSRESCDTSPEKGIAESRELHKSDDDLTRNSIPSPPVELDKAPAQGPSFLPSMLDGQVEPMADDTPRRRISNHLPGRNRRSRELEEPIAQQLALSSTKHRNSPLTIEKDRDSAEHAPSKSGINGPAPKSQDADSNRRLPLESQNSVSPKKSRRHAASTLSSKTFADPDEISPYSGITQSPILLSTKQSMSNHIVASENDSDRMSSRTDEKPRTHGKLSAPEEALEKGTARAPQSLAVLNIETINQLCKILQELDSFGLNSTFTKTPYLNEGLRRKRVADKDASSKSPPKLTPTETIKLSQTGPMWKLFIEQSLFFVLSRSDNLLYSFHEARGRFFDTQTIWYCMVCLIQYFPSLIFDSLWIAAADLYLSPREITPYLDLDRNDEKGFTANKAADMMSLCLHALIAAVPYIHDPVDLFTISRIRSYGLSTSQGRRTSKELAQLCLLYDDVFSNEMALRLARRVFAAIPVRRQYQELLALNSSSDASGSRPDILDLILAPLNFLDIEILPILDFSPEERHMHEKRAPTLLIDWARTVMLKDWTGLPEVPADGSFGGALALMQAIYGKRKSLLLGDVHFRTEYFADRLDSMEMPVQWLSFDRHSNKKSLHLLDYPYLFSPSTLVTYFRVINFSRMNRAFETSGSMIGRVHGIISSNFLVTDQIRRDELFDRLRTATSKFLVLQIRRTHVLADAFDHLWRREERELSRPLKIRLGEDSGEEGSDSGGVQQEFFRLAIAEALNPDYGTFSTDERTRMAWFQPSSLEPVWKFELIGLLVSLAIYNGLTLPVTFPKALYRKLLGLPVTELHHIEDGWPDLANGLSTLLDWDEKEGSIEDIFSRTYEFTIESFGQQISRDMAAGTRWPQFNEPPGNNPVDARMVTSENRNEYVSDYIQWLTDISIRPQFQAFQRGFFTCLDTRSLSLFDHDILQSVVEGVQEIDISELRRYTRYVGWPGDASHRTIKDFWSIVKKYGPDEKKKLLEFVTASDRVPVGGMRNLQFVIQKNGAGDIDGHLPTSYTCYGTLLLPEYSSKDILKEKLGMALENAKGFGFA